MNWRCFSKKVDLVRRDAYSGLCDACRAQKLESIYLILVSDTWLAHADMRKLQGLCTEIATEAKVGSTKLSKEKSRVTCTQ